MAFGLDLRATETEEMKILNWLTGDGAMLLLIAACLGAGAAVSYTATATHYKAKIADLKRQQAEYAAQVATRILETQQARAKQIEDALDEAHKQTQDAKAAAAAATTANRRLQAQLAAYKGRFTCTASTGEGESNQDPIGVLTDLLGRMGEAGERISRYADEVKIAGAACEAAWPKQ